MQKLALIFALSLPLPAVAAACTSGATAPSDADASTASDAAPPPNAADGSPSANDGSSPPPDSSSDAGPSPDASDASPPLPLVAGSDLHILAVTSDDYVIYWGATNAGASTNTVFAVPLTGGTPVAAAGPYSGYFYVYVEGPDVFVWELGTSSSNIVGPLNLWTHASGNVSLSSSSVEDNAWTSPDGGTQVGFVTNATDTQKDFAVANNDGTGVTTLVSGIYRSSCLFTAAFAGSGALVQHCDVPITDGGAVDSLPPTLSFFPSLSDAGHDDLVTLPVNASAYMWSSDVSGDALYAPSSAGDGLAFSLPGAAVTTIDPTGSDGLVLGDGSAVVYHTTGGESRRSPMAAAAPETLVASGVAGMLALSPDGTTMAYYGSGSVDSSGVFLTDLSVASATAPSAGERLVSVELLLDVAFTVDSQYVTYLITTAADDSSGTLSAAAAGDGGAPVQLGTNVTEYRLSTGARVVLADNYAASAGTVDVHAVDLAAGGAPTLIATGASGFRLSADHTQIVYATNAGSGGIYVVPVP